MEVLVAEDDRVSRRVLEKYLVKWGYDVVCAEDGHSAWDALNDQAYQMVVLDWMMPGLSGIDICRKIRQSPKINHLYILLLSGRTEKRDMIAGLEAGADDYVIKPFDPLELNSRLKVGRRLVDSGLLLKQKNRELEEYALKMEALAEERASMLVHADRLASLGILTAGVAHEINNPSTFISGNVQTLERCWPTIEKALTKEIQAKSEGQKKIRIILDEFPNMLNGIRSGVKRIAKIVNGLKTFSRTDKNVMEPLDVNDCIEQALLLCSNRLKCSTKLIKKMDSNLPEIFGDIQKLEQVLVNLFVNAADAMDECVTIDQGILTITSKVESSWVVIEVQDNGPGIPEDKLTSIWQPFFTTKDVGKGTGLGLAISQGIIHDHEGEITVGNRAEGGVRFIIKLPIRNR